MSLLEDVPPCDHIRIETPVSTILKSQATLRTVERSKQYLPADANEITATRSQFRAQGRTDPTERLPCVACNDGW